ncbi:serine proteinase stubble isoform X1 [Topomyia yanbarensis]|uniref:serine proteinase stubble isoform X1 n=1 Tax=Topomyia yanbarensis TaxID=2498891 RepID=UPI00273ABAA7|nr:serine proteinase stubble isoform X1 [Topomyia yanbarensis]XP_058821652.1 serine proteinase stubble isoform X1 [Topomyia yanbarensis]
MVDLGITRSSTTMWSRWKSSILLVIMISWIAKATPGTSQNFKITPKPCTVNGIDGTCMFVWECIKSEGQHVGVCVDSFMFGSCCSHNLSDNVIPQNYHQTVTYRPKPAGSNKHKPQKPSTFVSSNGYTTIYRPGNGGTLVIRPSHNHHQHHHPHNKPWSSSSSSSSSSNANSHFFSQKPTEGTVNKHSTLSTPAQQSDLEMAASSMSTGIFTTHWQATTEPSFITKTRPPKPSKPSKKPILSGSNNIQSTALKPKPSAKPTKPTTTTVKYTTTTSIISTTTRRPVTEPPTTATSYSTELVPTSTASIVTNTSLAAVALSTVIGGEGISSSPEMYTVAPGRSTLSAARNYECGVQTMGRPETRIVGGKNAPFGRWPWQVSVRRTSFFGFSSTHRCGGAVINDNWIVTAGHCVDDLLTSQIRIRVGEYDFSHVQEQLPYTERAVARKVVHPKYNFFTYEFDLALVKLEQALVFAPHISPICLPGTDDLLIGENATVTGWGRLSEGGTLPSVLQEVSVPIVSNDRCKTMFLRAGRHEFIPDIFLCAGHETGGQDSCQGDSGGPLQVKGKDGHYFLAGIISWGIGCAEANLPGVCTRISKFVPWIFDTVL